MPNYWPFLWKVWFGSFHFGVSLLWRLLLGASELKKKCLQGFVPRMLILIIVIFLKNYFIPWYAFQKVCNDIDAEFRLHVKYIVLNPFYAMACLSFFVWLFTGLSLRYFHQHQSSKRISTAVWQYFIYNISWRGWLFAISKNDIGCLLSILLKMISIIIRVGECACARVRIVCVFASVGHTIKRTLILET
jgi:hypothetical protein